MPERSVICNTSPLLYLHQVSCLELLAKLYGRIIVPPAVESELSVGRERGVNVPVISELNWIMSRTPAARNVLSAVMDLGPGEAEVLALGLEMRDSLLILDDRLARRIARLNGLRVTGTLGILVRAKKAGLVSAIAPILEKLRATSLWLSPELLQWALEEANESEGSELE
jgi:predicted nucleic acid-binding protein